jgi:hypothetical protein
VTSEQLASLKSIEINERMIESAAPGALAGSMDLAKLARVVPVDHLEHSGSITHTVREEHKVDIERTGPKSASIFERLSLSRA